MVCGLATSTASEWEVYGATPQACEENIKDIGEQVFQISIDNFFARVLPLVDEKEITQVLNRLRASGTLDRQTDEWLHFTNEGEPNDQSAHEPVVFKPIGDLVKDIINVSDPLKKVQFAYDNFPASVPESPENPDSYRPDGYFVLKTVVDDLGTMDAPGNPQMPWWRNLTLISEFNKAEGSRARNDDVCKVLWGMKHTMAEDFRRRFIYGLTIENTTARLWYSDRSQVIVSSPFNFITDAGRFVRLLYTFLYSDPTALGWDPSMNVHGRGKTSGLTYTVQVGARRFRTFGAQVHNAAASLMGRSTRVWNAREQLDSGGLSDATYVIKDTWTNMNRRREGDVYDILYGLKLPEREESALKRILLTKECHSDIKVSDVLDTTVDLSDLKDTGSVFHIVCMGPIEHSQPRNTSGTNPSPYYHEQDYVPPSLTSRAQMVHNRIVFKEFGTPLHAVESLGQMLRSFNDVAAGLYVLHKHGWVHRDISVGNILVCDDGMTKLVDFEYAKQHGDSDQTTRPERIGTESFMAVEVDVGAYLFTPRVVDEVVDDQSAAHEILEPLPAGGCDATEHASNNADESQTSQKPFRHNPLHDLESLKWVCIHLITGRRIISVGGGKKRPNVDDYSRLDEQHQWALKLSHNSRERTKLLMNPSRFLDLIRTLDPRVQPLGHFLKKISAALVARYALIEKDVGSIDSSAAGNLYAFFRPTIKNGVNLQDFEDIRVAKIDQVVLKEERIKRRRLV